jgi:succinoglycan biosynthesis transport protein ExoP
VTLTAKRRWDQVRQRWWVVAVLIVLAVLAAASSLPARPTYVGKSTLALSGQGPQQDALVVVGYMTIFNDPATIARLSATAKFPEDVTFEAKAVAASPILSIEASANSPEVAQEAAMRMASAFRDDVNSVKEAGAESSAAELRRQLTGVPPLAPDGSANPYFVALQQRINDAQDSANLLQDLQPRAGVTENAPKIATTLGLGAAGGLLLGILAALGLAALSTRLRNSADLRDKTGVEPLVEMPDAGLVKLDSLRRDRLRTLANLVSFEDLPKATVIILTDSRGVRAARDVAEALAELSAQQGSRTVLVYADNDASRPAGGAGFNDALIDSGLVHDLLKDGDVGSLKILPAGSIVADRYWLVTRERVVAVLDELRADADTIIVAAPSIADTTETQLLCAAADVTILVVSRGSSRTGDVISASEALAKAHAVLLGAVLIDGTNRKHQGRRSPRSQTPAPPSNRWTERQDEQQFAGSRQQSASHNATEPIA